MINWSDLPIMAAIAAAVLLACGLAYYAAARRRNISTRAYAAKVKRDWMTTGRINFSGDWETITDEHTPRPLHVQVEETRITENIGGGPNIEIRWRSATLGEAKQIVARYHQFLDEHPDKARTGDPIKMESPAFVVDNVEPITSAPARKFRLG